MERDEIRVIDRFGGKLEGSADVIQSELRIRF